MKDKQPEDVSPHFDANLDTYLQRLRGDVCSTILMQNQIVQSYLKRYAPFSTVLSQHPEAPYAFTSSLTKNEALVMLNPLLERILPEVPTNCGAIECDIEEEHLDCSLVDVRVF